MGRVLHFDIQADDPERAAAFYERLFGWTAQRWDGPMEYWLLTTGPDDRPGINGGLAKRTEPVTGSGGASILTVDVEDLDKALALVTAAGGDIATPRRAIPGVGWHAEIVDTEGNTIGMMQDDPNAA